MPYYNDLRPEADHAARDFQRFFPPMAAATKARCIEGLIRLKAQIAREVPARRTEGNLLVASWNIVSLGAGSYRDAEAFHYMAEILAAFDLIAIQELRPGLHDLSRLARMLGPNWRFLGNDPTGGDAGNDERSCYLFNTDRVALAGVAGELSLWDDYDGDRPGLLRSLKRPPYMTGFRTGWKDFALVNLHLHPHKKRGDPAANPPVPSSAAIRQAELELLLAVLADRKEQLWTENLILVGDTNFARGHDEMNIELLHAAGFWESAGLVGKTTNIVVSDSAREAYDRMFFSQGDYFRIATRDGVEQGGVFDIFQSVYRLGDWPDYRTEMRDKRDDAADREKMMADDTAAHRYFRDTYRKRQLSDHHLIWVELEVDDSAAFLGELAGG